MKTKKRYALTVARIPWPQLEEDALVVLIPWEHFEHENGPIAYRIQFARVGAKVAIVAKKDTGEWGSDGQTEPVFFRMWKENPLDSLHWHQMFVETDFLPQELFDKL